jgi:hypothetical protein
MSDDENILDFGDDQDGEFGQMMDEESMAGEGGLLQTFPTLGKAYNWWLGALDTLWDFAGVFQPLFKNTWVLLVIYIGLNSGKGVSFLDMVPLLSAPAMEDEEEEN